MWQLLEPLHTVTYFAPQARAAAEAIGMRGYWMGYFAMRAAPLGEAGPALVTSTFYGFPPARVARAIPDAWAIADCATVLQARLDGVDAALRAILPADQIDSAQLERLLSSRRPPLLPRPPPAGHWAPPTRRCRCRSPHTCDSRRR